MPVLRINSHDYRLIKKLMDAIPSLTTPTMVIKQAMIALGEKHRRAKLQLPPDDTYEYVPRDALESVIEVFRNGCEKPGRYPFNWRDRGPDYEKNKRAAMERHLKRHDDGELFDDESGMPALAHAAANLLIELDLVNAAAGDDDGGEM